MNIECNRRPHNSRTDELQRILCMNYAGNQNATLRQELLRELTGIKHPKAKAGINKINEEYLKYEKTQEEKKYPMEVGIVNTGGSFYSIEFKK